MTEVNYLFNNDNNVVPVSPLDNFLVNTNLKDYELKFYNMLNGEELNTINKIWSYYKQLTNMTNEKKSMAPNSVIFNLLQYRI